MKLLYSFVITFSMFLLLMEESLVISFKIPIIIGSGNCCNHHLTTIKQQRRRHLCRPPGDNKSDRIATTTTLYDISGWRDLYFDEIPVVINEDYDDDHHRYNNQLIFKKSICVLPVPHQEVLLQGETKQIRLSSLFDKDEQHLLLNDVMENHCGLFAMGLVCDSGGTIQAAPLCEIDESSENDNTITLRVVGRAHLVRILQEQPYMKAICQEVNDDKNDDSSLELLNLVANIIENTIIEMNTMEHQLAQIKHVYLSKLKGHFKNDDKSSNNEDWEKSSMDRYERFQEAYQMALSSDTQGYHCTTLPNTNNNGRTLQELTAISWAAFCPDGPQPQQRDDYYNNILIDSSQRIQALDTESLFERLKLASHILREKRSQLQFILEQQQQQQQQQQGGIM